MISRVYQVNILINSRQFDLEVLLRNIELPQAMSSDDTIDQPVGSSSPPYIPASSIMGAIRTVLERMLKFEHPWVQDAELKNLFGSIHLKSNISFTDWTMKGQPPVCHNRLIENPVRKRV